MYTTIHCITYIWIRANPNLWFIKIINDFGITYYFNRHYSNIRGIVFNVCNNYVEYNYYIALNIFLYDLYFGYY